MNPLFLVGFMGTGKTAVAHKLADRLSQKVIDLDDLIEEKAGKKIVDIFSDDGEAAFRIQEHEALKYASKLSDCVVSCGGGIVLNPQNIEIMEEYGYAVCLDAAPEVIYQRTKNFTHRPLLNVENPLEKITELLELRRPCYDAVSFHVDTSELSIEEVVESILEFVDKKVPTWAK